MSTFYSEGGGAEVQTRQSYSRTCAHKHCGMLHSSMEWANQQLREARVELNEVNGLGGTAHI